MIIKFKSGDTWVVFGEVDHVEYRELDYFPDKMAVSSNVLVYDPPKDQSAFNRIAMSFFTKNMNAATEAIACTPIYLMNDQGRTVEII
jgi:hypothetical protein